MSGKETAVVYEQSMNGGFGQSCRGYVLLRYLGYPKIKILHGGYVAWAAAGLPTTTAVPTPTAKAFALDPAAAGILVDLQGMKAAVADPNLVKLDTRDVDLADQVGDRVTVGDVALDRARRSLPDGHGRVMGNLALAGGRAGAQLRDRHDRRQRSA